MKGSGAKKGGKGGLVDAGTGASGGSVMYIEKPVLLQANKSAVEQLPASTDAAYRMEKQEIHCQFYRRPLSVLLCAVLLYGYAYGRLTPEELAAISESGLIPLTGEQEDEYPARDYVIVETMRVPRGKTMKFTPGTRVFFHPDARITIQGSLFFEGTAGNPVTIGKCTASLPGLSAGGKAVFDSTSIFVYRGAHLAMRHAVLEDPSIRVRFTDSTSTFELDSVACSGNRFTFSDTTLLFPDSTVVTCSNTGASIPIPCIPVIPAMQSEPAPKRTHPIINAKLPFQIVLGIGFVAAGAAWYIYNKKAETAAADYYNAGTIADAQRYYRDNHRAALYRDCAAAGGGCCIAGFTVTFFIGGGQR